MLALACSHLQPKDTTSPQCWHRCRLTCSRSPCFFVCKENTDSSTVFAHVRLSMWYAISSHDREHHYVVVACAVSEHRSRAPVESCGVVYCTPQALSLFLESCGSCVTLHKLCHCFLSHGTLCCVSHCVCVLSSLSIVLLCIYTAVDWELSPQSHSLHCRLVALLPLIPVSFPPLQSPWCSVTQGPFESRF